MRILLPVDGSEHCRNALRFIASRQALSPEKEATVELLNVQHSIPEAVINALGLDSVRKASQDEGMKVIDAMREDAGDLDVRAKVDAVFETAQFRVRLDRAAVHALHGAPVVQFLKVLAQGGLGDAHLLGEVGDDHAAAVGDALEDELLTFCLHHAGLLRLVYAVAGR